MKHLHLARWWGVAAALTNRPAAPPTLSLSLPLTLTLPPSHSLTPVTLMKAPLVSPLHQRSFLLRL